MIGLEQKKSLSPPYVVGVDVGGTFTDSVLLDSAGGIVTGKALSTPPDFWQGALDSIADAASSLGCSRRELFEKTRLLVHGTTIAENALITGTGVKAGLITTRGFEDTMLIMRVKGRWIGLSESEITHIVRSEKPKPIIPRDMIEGVIERIDSEGEVVTPLDPASVESAVLRLLDRGAQSLAISLLWSFVNPVHEKAVEEIARRLAPGLFITKGSELAPYIGEYERTATAAMNAYLSDVAKRYLARLMERLEEEGFQAPLLVTQGHGGALQGEAAVRNVVGMMESGPASGMVASRFVGGMVNASNIIATDMGGTTFKVGLITEGRFEHATDPNYSRYNVQVPKIDIRSIGAGGGTIAYIDKESGALRIGPRSAGAVPGPSCYGFGGQEPTVTDADLVLGYLNPDFFLGGRMRLDRKAAEEAIERYVAKILGLSVVEAAAGIYKIACSHSADLIRKISIERGYDTGDFVLFAYGGAGPVHAGMYAQQLGVAQILVPFTASVHCAMGAVCSDIVREYGQSDPMRLPADAERVNANFEKLEARASNDFRSDRIEGHGVEIRRFLDLKFRRQVHVVRVAVLNGKLAEQDLSLLQDDFQNSYERRYGKGSAFRGAGTEIVSFRVEAVRRLPKPRLHAYPVTDRIPREALAGKRLAYFVDIENPAAVPSAEKEASVYRLPGLLPGNSVGGPAIIETPVTTIVLHPGQRARVDAYLNVVIEVR